MFVSILPARVRACAEPLTSTYPSVPWTTHIQSITPQVGLAGITEVYVQGYCFGDSVGSISIGGVAVTDIKSWADDEIEFVVPWNATTGDLVVTSNSTQDYGSDDSASESVCCGEGCSDGENWPDSGATQECGNDVIATDFTVVSPSSPPFIDPPGSPGCDSTTPCYHTTGSVFDPQWVQGSWYFSTGDRYFTLSQGTQDATGAWTITGTEWSSAFGGPYPILSGEMDPYGNVMIQTGKTGYCLDFTILNSGDVTTPSYFDAGGGACGPPEPPESLFPEADEGPYWFFIQPPLFKSQSGEPPFVSQTDVPALETPAPQGWAGPVNTIPTYGLWERTDAGSPDLTGMFESRFVYEQSGGAATDLCDYTGSGYLPVTSATTGGGWFLNQTDQWGLDIIGISSGAVTTYQDHWAQYNEGCAIAGPQAMYIDSRLDPAAEPFQPYTENTLMTAEITPTQLLTGVQPQGGSMVTECENYPSTKGKCH
jgi:hypothetical protein